MSYFQTLLVCIGSGGGVPLQVSANVTTGVAPLSVFFNSLPAPDATTLTTLRTTQFLWNFGDSGAGTWAQGAVANASKNTRYAPSAGHLYETPGTYTVTLTVTPASGSVQVRVFQIVVLDPNVVFAGAATACMSNSADFTGAPVGSTQITTANVNDAAMATYMAGFPVGGFRLLYKSGDTFTGSSSGALVGFGAKVGIRVGSFGTGAQPICKNTIATPANSAIFQWGVDYTSGAASTGLDGVVNGLNLQGDPGNTAGRGVQNFDSGPTVAAYDAASLSIIETKGRIGAVNCTFTNVAWPIALSGTGPIAVNNNISLCPGAGVSGILGIGLGFNSGCTNAFVAGNFIDRSNTGEHGIRAQGIAFADIYSNYVKQCGGTKHLMTFREFASPSASYQLPSQYIFRSNNVSDGQGGTNMSSYCQYAPQNTSNYGLIQYIIDDHNMDIHWDWATPTASYTMPGRIVTGQNIIFRHNVSEGSDTSNAGSSGYQFFQLQNGAATTPPTPSCSNIIIDKTSCYIGTQLKASLVNLGSTTSNVTVTNTVLYAPNCIRDGSGSGSQATLILGIGSQTGIVQNNNSTLPQIKSTDPQWVTAVPVLVTDFVIKTGTGSYALTGSTTGGVMGANILDLSAI